MLARYTAALHARPIRYASVPSEYAGNPNTQLAVNRWLQGMLLRAQPGVPGRRTLAQIHHYNIPDMEQRQKIDPRIAAQLHAMLGQVFQGDASAFPMYHDLARDHDAYPNVGRVPSGALLGNLNTELQRRMGLHHTHPLIRAYGGDTPGSRAGQAAMRQTMQTPVGDPADNRTAYDHFDEQLSTHFGIPRAARAGALQGEMHPLTRVLRQMTEQNTTHPLVGQLAAHLGANMDAREAWARGSR